MIGYRSNSATASHSPKADCESKAYRDKVAKPTMEAVDALPRELRDLVNEFGYVEVYRIRRLPLATIRRTLGG